jgi:hypothetical protein
MFRSKLLNLKPIIFGGITWIFLLLLLLLTNYVFRQINLSIPNIPLLLFFIFTISGVVAGYTSGKKYVTGISNAAFIGFFITAIIGLYGNVQYFFLIGTLMLFIVLSAVGGIIGVLINRKDFLVFRTDDLQ